MNRKDHPKFFFTQEEKDRIVQAIRDAEQKTSGEIRVHLERKARGDVMKKAKRLFERLGMTKTKLRNGVLIYFSLADRSFALLGDQGIHEKVGDNFWKEVVSGMGQLFSQEKFSEGLQWGIGRIGEKLRLYFPHHPDDVNELPDVL